MEKLSKIEKKNKVDIRLIFEEISWFIVFEGLMCIPWIIVLLIAIL